jgi:2-polyprenyl-3-methyl-5-hydroxy-6-metoxy-1,4-benzoquinol methylase
MNVIRKFKLDYDWKEFVRELDERYPLEDYKFHKEFPTANGTYHHDILEGDMPPHLREAIERSLGFKIKDYYFLWDWRCLTTTLSQHRDTYKAAKHTGISDFDSHVFETTADEIGKPPLTVVVALENDFRIDIQDSESKEWLSVVYGPGDIIFFNNDKDLHGGQVLNDPENISRRSLNCYVDHKEVEGLDWLNENIVHNVPWPEIKTKIDNGQRVPLKEDYEFSDMSYLDTPEAYELFETQANIIIEKQCKGIVDVGCRHGPVLDILYAKGYTDFEYMGFDTSKEPIDIATEKWKDYDNIEFRHESWNDLATFLVDFDVDQVIWSGVLLYRPDDHFEFFNKITNEIYKSPNAIIQEPMSWQRHWKAELILNRISDDMEQYKNTYKEFKEHKLDLEIFAGRRLVVDITL